MIAKILGAAGQLPPGEVAEVVTVTQLGSPSQDLRRTAAGVVFGAATGTVVASRGHRYGLILTNRRLLFVDAKQGSGKFIPGIKYEFPRSDVRATSRPTGRLMKGFDVVSSESEPIVRLNFPIPAREDGETIASALGAS